MQIAPVTSRSSLSRTSRVAAWVLALAALAEIGAGAVALIRRSRNNPPLTIQVPPPGLIPSAPPAPGPHAETFTPVDPFAAVAAATPLARKEPQPGPAQATTPATALPRPTPVETSQVTTPESRMDTLVAQARALRERGDMSTAITRLREALAVSPKNALIISELAATYEKMGLQDKSLEQWRLIFDMGESAGIYYQAADAKLKASELAGAVPPGPSPAADALGEAGGFQPGSSLALVNLSTVEKPATSEGYKQFTLKIPVKRRPNIKINVSDVIIQVFFYDQLGDETVVRTNANVSSHWSTLPADWQEDDLEILEVDYKQAPPEPGKIEEDRHYYGYVVCVYYKHDLQDMAADPQTLLKKFPPPLTLSSKGEGTP